MAVWTYKALLVPKKEFIHNLKINYKTIGFKKFYQNTNFKFDIEKYLDHSFSRIEHWSESVKSWGDGKNNINLRFNHPLLYTQNNRITRIRIELDLRSINIKILEKFIDLAIKLDSYIVQDREKFNIVEPTLEEIIKDIKTSLAFEFVSDPDKYLDNIDIFNKK